MSENRDEFQISLSLEGLPEEIRVIPAGDVDEPKYELYNAADYLGTVWPECVEQGVCWFSSDELQKDKDYALNERGSGDPLKAESAVVFYKKYKEAEAQPVYKQLKAGWKKAYG